jgi:hypothetical protein
MGSSTGDMLPSSEKSFALSSGEPIPELGGVVSGEGRCHPFADQTLDVDTPGLTADVIECELGNDLPSRLCAEGAIDACC